MPSDRCGDLLDIAYDWDRAAVPKRLSDFEQFWSQRTNPIRFSGVWRFHELLPFAPHERIVTVGEGQTLLQQTDSVGSYIGMNPGTLHLLSVRQVKSPRVKPEGDVRWWGNEDEGGGPTRTSPPAWSQPPGRSG